jgi:hypothetical protein
MKKGFIVILFLIVGCAKAQAPQKFYTRFGGYNHDIGYGVIQTLNGHYAVTGSTGSFGYGNTDAFIALVDSMGWVRWEKSYGGFNNDIGRSIIQLADSGFVIAGYTDSFGGGGYDVLVVRTDKNGTLIWQKAFGGLDWDFGYCVKTCPTGDSLIVAGSTYSYGYGKMDGYILKLDLNGNLQWQKTYGGAEDDEFRSFVLTSSKQYAFAGTTKSMGDINGDCWLVKTGLASDSIFSIKHGDNKKQFLNDIVEGISGDFVMAGATDIAGRDTTWGYLLSLDQNGNFNYENNFPRSEKFKDYQLTCVTRGNNANYIYVYKTFDAPAGFQLEPLFMDITGMWPTTVNTYGSTSDEEIFDICRTKDRGFIAVGYTTGFSTGPNDGFLDDVFLVKMDSTLFNSQNFVGVPETPKVLDNIFIYPTITNDLINISIEPHLLDKTVLYVTNSYGERLPVSLIKSNQISVKNFTSGIYFITLMKDGFSRSFKVIKTD